MYSFKALLTASIILLAASTYAQVTPSNDTAKINSNEFTKVEVEAEYPGGNAAWKKFLEKSLNSAIPSKNSAPVGKYTAAVLFIVDKDGSVSNIKAVTNFGYGMEEELVRVIEKSGKWTAAMQNGKPVKAYRKQPVTFILDSGDFEITTAEPYTLFTNADNEISITARKVKAADIGINVVGGSAIPVSDGKYIVRVKKPGRITIEIVNSKKDDKEIGVASFEVKAK